MKKGLIVIDTFPFPATDGGKMRTSNIIKQLSKEFELDLVVSSNDPVFESQISQAKVYAQHIDYHVETKSSTAKIFYMLCLRSLRPYSSRIQQIVDQKLEDNHYDFIWVERLYCHQYFSKHYKDRMHLLPPVIVDMHDNEREVAVRSRKGAISPFEKLYYAIAYIHVVQIEEEMVRYATRITTASKRDMENYQRIFMYMHDKWAFIDNGIDVSIADHEPDVQRDENTLLFIGPFWHRPNRTGMKWFVKDVWSKILDKKPDAKLYVVGKLKGQMEQGKNVEYLGFVQNVYALLRKSTCFIVPLKIGSGTRLKILEAMSFRIPIVATQIGAEGIVAKDREHILIADTEDDFAHCVIELLENKELANQLVENGYKLVSRLYDWNIIGEKIRSIANDTINKYKNEKI